MRDAGPILKGFDRVGRFAENATLVTLLTGMMTLAVGQIILRQFFNTGFIWADELIKLIVLWLAMVGSVAAARDNRHIRIDVLSHVLPATAIRYIRVVVDLLAAVVCVVIAWHAWRYLQLEIEFEDTVLVDTPAWYAHLIVPLAFALTGYRLFVGAAAGALGIRLPGRREDVQ